MALSLLLDKLRLHHWGPREPKVQILLTERELIKLVHRDTTFKGAHMRCLQADFRDRVLRHFTAAGETRV